MRAEYFEKEFSFQGEIVRSLVEVKSEDDVSGEAKVQFKGFCAPLINPSSIGGWNVLCLCFNLGLHSLASTPEGAIDELYSAIRGCIEVIFIQGRWEAILSFLEGNGFVRIGEQGYNEYSKPANLVAISHYFSGAPPKDHQITS